MQPRRSFLDCLCDDCPSSSDEEEELEKKVPPKPPPFSTTLEKSLLAEQKALRDARKSKEADILEENKEKIFRLWAGAQAKLWGMGEIEPVKHFISSRLKDVMPFSYCFQTRPFTDEDWNFLAEHEESLIRILYGTFMEFRFPAESILDVYRNFFMDTRVELHNHFHAEWREKQLMMEMRVGRSEGEAARFLQEHPEAVVEDARLKKEVVERCKQMGTDEETVRRMVDTLPAGLLALSISGKEDEEARQINASRDPSPERQSNNEDVEEDSGLDSDENLLAFLMPKNPFPAEPTPPEGIRTGPILKREKGWYRSDDVMKKEMLFAGVVTYKEYRKTKKKVTFKDDFPTEVHIYFPVLPKRQENRRLWPLYGNGHFYGAVNMAYETYKEVKPIIKVPTAYATPSSSTSLGGFMRKVNGPRVREILYNNPVVFVNTKMLRSNFSDDQGDPEAVTLPVHVGKRRKDLGEVVPGFMEGLSRAFLNRIRHFRDHWNGSKAVQKDYKLKTKHNYCSGVLILTDGIFEEVLPNAILNGDLFASPPPLTVRDILGMLRAYADVNVHVHDVIVSWGFDEITTKGKSPEEGVAALLVSCTLIQEQMKMLRQESNKKLGETDEELQEKPKMWMFTIPEFGDFAEKLMVYNDLVRKVRADDLFGIELLDWAKVVAEAPPMFFYANDADICDRMLQLFFRLCRDKCGLLYRRGCQERSVEKTAIAKEFGTGPWLNDFYSIFSNYSLKKKEPRLCAGEHPKNCC